MKRNQKCQHGRQQPSCKDCKGSQICKHLRQRTTCKDCGGSQICSHNRRRTQCYDCSGLIAIARILLSHARKRARKDKISFSINVNDILEVFGDRCPALGTKFIFHQVKNGSSATLDRFIPSLGYIKGNIFVISDLANRIKSNAAYDQVQRVADWMLINQSSAH
jgi:hypothetical protein